MMNEITGSPEILEFVDVKGAIVALDAIEIQKEVAKAIVDGGGDSVPSLRGNHGTLQRAVAEYFAEQIENDLADMEAEKDVTATESHDRIETRETTQLPVEASLPGCASLAGL